MAGAKRKSTGDVLDGIKSRLGFAKEDSYAAQSYDDYQDTYDENYDEEYQDSYDDYNYQEEYQDDYDSGSYQGSTSEYDSYSEYNPAPSVTTRIPGRAPGLSPRLVNAHDVRERTIQMESDRYSRGSGSARSPRSPRSTTSQSLGLERSGEFNNDRFAHIQRRSEGLDSLFSPSASPVSANASKEREVKIIKPAAYNDVSDVASFVGKGDVVVLSLKTTPASLSNRVLDFCFGVASALQAHVETLEPSVYVITTGAPISLSEKANLRTKGVI